MFNEKVEINLPISQMRLNISEIPTKNVLCLMHMHPELELLYVRKGKILYHTQTSNFEVKCGEIIFSNSYSPHYTESVAENTETVCIFFKKPTQPNETTKYLSDFIEKNVYSYHLFSSNEEITNDLKSIFESMANEYTNQLSAYEYFILSKKYEIIALLCRNNYISVTSNLKDGEIKPILPILKYIEENYHNDIKLDDISKEISLHKNYICRLFKKITKKTVTEYLNYVRICKAKELLNSDIQLIDIAYKVGFSSQSYFNKIFKKYVMYTPLEYKKLTH